uniref:Golgin subfamily A member 2-like n=1 Tax=Sinocyclocheilus rhinocerous TaxID=307959 RepID=A0A673GIA4_9TELE
MADQNRQIKLAAAKKKLKEFQQKTTPSTGSAGPKKKRKVKAGDQLDAAADRHSPDNVSQELEETSAEPVSNPASAINSDNPGLQVCLSRPLSSTESLRQISQQLNGLLSDSTTYINGDSGPPTVSEKELETRNQELAVALDSSALTNTQLSSKLETLTKQSQELSDQLQKERKEFEQKFTKEQGAMREQLQVHIQTIGILVSEKSELQTALSYTQQAARHKTAEAEDLSSRLQASKRRVSELERTLSSVSTQQKQFEKHNRELEKERDSLRLEVLRFSNVSEESRQQSSELSEHLKLRVNENNGLKQEVDELRKRLEMADSMLQQFSSQAGSPSEHQQVQLLLEEKHQIEAHAAQLMESVAQLQVERDQYAGQIQEEGHVWKDKTEQLLSQVNKHTHIQYCKNKLLQYIYTLPVKTLMSKEQEPQAVSQASGPSESELALQETISSLQQERDALSLQYQAQVTYTDHVTHALLNILCLKSLAEKASDGLESYSLPESFQKSHIVIPEDFESREEMEEFIHSALSRLEEERDEMSRRFEEERRLHHAVRQQMAAMSHEQLHFCLRMCCVVCVGEYIALYQNQRAIMKQRHYEKEQYISMLAKDKEEMKAKLAELQDLVMRLVGERNEWYSRYMSAVGNPDLLSSGGERLHPADGHTESPGATAQSHSYKLIPIQFAQMSRFSEPVQLQAATLSEV